MSVPALDETPVLCVLCPAHRARPTRPGGLTDWECHERLGAQVLEVVRRYARLTARPTSGAGLGRRAPGYHSRPPVDMHVAALRDPRTAPVRPGDPHSALNLLLTWSRWMRRLRGQDPARYPTDADDLFIAYIESEYLTASMDWITRQDWVTVFAEQMRIVVSQLRSANGEPNPRPVGWCVAQLVTSPPAGVSACGHPLFAPRGEDLDMECRGCGAVYDPLEQIRMLAKASVGCVGCGHTSAQHSNDLDTRRCAVRWCDCPDYAEGHHDRVDPA